MKRKLDARLLATKNDIQRLAARTERGLEQIVVTSAATLKLTQKEMRALRARVERLERMIHRME